MSTVTEDEIKYYTEATKKGMLLFEAETLLVQAQRFMNQVPNNKYGDNYSLCAMISEFLKKIK